MDLAQALELVNKTNGSHLYEIYIPSAKKSFPFKPLTTGQQKSLSKFAMNIINFNFSYELIKLGIFDELIQDDTFNSSMLTEIDMVAFSAALRLNNISDPLNISCICDKCDTKFNYEIKLSDIVDRCAKYEETEYNYNFEMNKIKYELVIKNPTYRNLIELEEYLIQFKNDSNDITDNEITSMRAFNKPATYIHSVKLNGTAIDDFEYGGFINKLQFYNTLSPSVSFNGDDSIMGLILKEFNLSEPSEVMGSIKCENKKCGIELEGVLTNDNFFII